MRSLYIATTGMLAQQTNIEVTSNNLANMTTAGYKRQQAQFQDLLYQNYRRVGTQTSDVGTVVPAGIQLGLGVKTGSVYRVHEQGTLDRTENPLDLAINGRGYLQVQMPNGETAYTRDGTFKLSPEGEIVTADGYQLLPGIVVPDDAEDVTIASDGTVQIKFSDQVESQNVGQIEIAYFVNDAGLQARGDNLYTETTASGVATVVVPGEDSTGTLMQGYLENANVNAVSEITRLITAQRAYEMNAKVISTTDEMLQAANASKR